jgi:hypothetical protein
MKKLSYAAFCFVVGMAFGCIPVEYAIITDNDQTNGDSSNGGTGDGAPVNTNGKAHIRETTQFAAAFPDGTYYENISFIDQKPDGTATLTTYGNTTPPGGDPNSLSIFHDDLYCNPDWNGCSVYTSQDNNDCIYLDGVGNSVNCFDGQHNGNCGSLVLLLASDRYYGSECGRNRLRLEDRLTVLASGRLRERAGVMGLVYNLNASNFNIVLDNNRGTSTNLPVRGNMQFRVSGGNRRVGILDASNPLFGSMGRQYATWLGQNGTGTTTVTACYLGICKDTRIAGNVGGPSSPSRILANVNRLY